MIGVTGSTGHLGQEILRILDGAVPIHHDIPDYPYAAIIHTACPNWRDPQAIELFDDFNHRLNTHITRNRVRRVINLGSWWQYALGEAQTLPYTYLKHRQMRNLQWTGAHITNIIPYSIYGDQPRPGRGFIPQLIQAIRDGVELAGLSEQQRDFIHVTDVALACIQALHAPPGTYTAATGVLYTPKQLAATYGLTAFPYPEYPTATPRYNHDQVPGWQPQIHVLDHIDLALSQ